MIQKIRARLNSPEVRKEEGFSLLEIVIWIAVAGIITAIALVGFMQVKRSATLSEVQTVVQSVAVTAESRYLEQNMYYVFGPLEGRNGKEAIVNAVEEAGYDTDTATQMAAWLNKHDSNRIVLLATDASETHKVAVAGIGGDSPERCVIFTSETGGIRTTRHSDLPTSYEQAQIWADQSIR